MSNWISVSSRRQNPFRQLQTTTPPLLSSCDRWYKHEGHTIAYSLSFIPIELVGRLQIDLNSTDALLEFLEHTCYEQGHHCSRCVTYSTAGNFSAKNYKLSSHDSFLMTQENVYDENEEILVVSKHYIPAEVFELKFSI